MEYKHLKLTNGQACVNHFICSTFQCSKHFTYSILLSFLQQLCKAGQYYFSHITDEGLRLEESNLPKSTGKVHGRGKLATSQLKTYGAILGGCPQEVTVVVVIIIATVPR